MKLGEGNYGNEMCGEGRGSEAGEVGSRKWVGGVRQRK